MFPHRICINLDRRSDRWANCLRQFESHGISVRRQSARDGLTLQTPAHWRFGQGAYGCALSHIEAVREARDRGYESLLVFEDDVVLHADFRALFGRFANELPSRWDAILLGSIHHEEPSLVSQHVARITSSYSTFAYALNRSIFDTWLERNEKFTLPVDNVNMTLQEEFAFYCSLPPLAWVTQDYSDIEDAEVNHWWVRDGLAVDGSQSRETVARTGVVVVPPRDRPAPTAKIFDFVLDELRQTFPTVTYCAEGWTDDRILPASTRFPGAECDYWVVTESDLYVPAWELKASLLKCREYDMVAPLHAPLRLTATDTARVLDPNLDPVDTTRYSRARPEPGFPGFSILRTATLGRLKASAPERVFYSPSRVFRLSQ
jgi:hypothetical protein